MFSVVIVLFMCLVTSSLWSLTLFNILHMQAFHVFHTSCLIHWVLLCEFEMARNQSVSPEVRRRSRRKNGAKCNKTGKDGKMEASKNQIDSVFCPACQGTGVNIEGDDLEKPTIPLSEVCFVVLMNVIVLLFMLFPCICILCQKLVR